MPYKQIAFQQTVLTKVPKIIPCEDTFINGNLKKWLKFSFLLIKTCFKSGHLKTGFCHPTCLATEKV